MAVRARLIYNPTSGREEIKKKLPDVLERLERGGIETSCHATIGEGDATLAAMDAVEREFDIIIAAGGDGTLYEVVNGMAEKEFKPKLGILPLGTSNDFARAVGIPKNWEYACDLITQQHSKAIDLGKMNNRYFINIAGGGSMTELTYEVPSKLKTIIGQFAYYIKGLEKLPRLRPIEINLRSEEMNFHDDVMMFLIANSNSVGGVELVAPNASLQDGKLDVFVFKKCNLAEFIKIVSIALRGEQIVDPHVVHFQSKRIEITSPDYVQINLDGELGGLLPSTFSILPSHINVIVDQEENPAYRMKNGVTLLR